MTRRGMAIVVGLLALGALAFVALGRRGPTVDVRASTRGTIAEWVEGTGKARVRERHVISAPVAGSLLRVKLHPGDPLQAGDVVAQVVPMVPAPLDARTRAELEARVAAAHSAELEAAAVLRRSQVVEADANRAHARAKVLHAAQAVPLRELEAAEAAARGAAEQVGAARAAVERARRERLAVEARLDGPEAGGGASIRVTTPVRGQVLRVTQESPGPVQAGLPILEVGDPDDLEIALELLTEQAARICPGAAVEIGAWGGSATLDGVVRHVEPSAFTKVSALGVEEQRVLVLVDPAGNRAAWELLGDGWRVEGRVLVEERAGAVKVPASSVFKDRVWAVFVVEEGRARKRAVRVGVAAGEEVEIVSGLAEGEDVISNPSTELADGARVRVRR